MQHTDVAKSPMSPGATEHVQIIGSCDATLADSVLTPGALRFLRRLHDRFESTRAGLLRQREERQAEISAGGLPDFLSSTAKIRQADWKVAPAPADLTDRRVEITGPVERKMIINALNSGASVFMADFEDALSPTWSNVLEGQQNLIDAVRRRLQFTSPDGKSYKLGDRTATLVVRPRGWHLVEKHVEVDGAPLSASLFDFGLYFFHNARELLDRGSGPYFYLPKLESHLEARLWNDVFEFAQEALGIPRGSIRATVLIETILAAFEMDEILYELREHASGLNAGRWDYIFSVIKKLRDRSEVPLPDRAQVTMAVPFMRAYAQLLVRTCHRRGAHAMGGMAAFIPNRRDRRATELALSKVREDKVREAGDGFDGTWVAHPDLVPVARDVFDRALVGPDGEPAPHQKHVLRDDVRVTADDLLDVRSAAGRVTEAGVRGNVRVALQYLEAWLRGSGAVAIDNLMEDAATAEIARAQLWQWVRVGASLDNGARMNAALYEDIRRRELQALERTRGAAPGRYREAAALLDALVLADGFTDFLTIPAYRHLD